jgi:superfamily II DNA helicase RecQ
VNNLICDQFYVYNSKTSSSRLLKNIKMKCYTHVLINSKVIIQNAIFKEMLQDSNFQEKLNLIIVDEIHLIFQWFEWRKIYKRFEEFWNIVFRFIFFFVISTTLITFMINKLINSLKLNNLKIIREFINKKNIFINFISYKKKSTSRIKIFVD